MNRGGLGSGETWAGSARGSALLMGEPGPARAGAPAAAVAQARGGGQKAVSHSGWVPHVTQPPLPCPTCGGGTGIPVQVVLLRGAPGHPPSLLQGPPAAAQHRSPGRPSCCADALQQEVSVAQPPSVEGMQKRPPEGRLGCPGGSCPALDRARGSRKAGVRWLAGPVAVVLGAPSFGNRRLLRAEWLAGTALRSQWEHGAGGSPARLPS